MYIPFLIAFCLILFYSDGKSIYPIGVIVVINLFTNFAYLGEQGLKISDRFIPRIDIIKYSYLESKLHIYNIELTVKDIKKPIKLKVPEKNKAELINTLEEYFNPISNDI